MVTQNIKIIMDDRKLPEIRMVSGDVGRDIFPVVYPSENDEEALDLTTYELRVIFIKPDNTFVIQDYLDGMIEIPEQAGAVTGRGFYQIRISKTGEEIYSGQGDFYIDDQILNEGLVESIAEANSMKFPDDFLTEADLSDYVKNEQLDDYYTKTEVDAELNNIRNYSTSERVVGSWIDSKPVYEKTFVKPINSMTQNTLYDIDTLSDVDTVVSIQSCYRYEYFTAPTVDQFENDHFCRVIYDKNDSKIKAAQSITAQTTNRTYTFIITIRYTKTTD